MDKFARLRRAACVWLRRAKGYGGQAAKLKLAHAITVRDSELQGNPRMMQRRLYQLPN
jgi:hypothetical protein